MIFQEHSENGLPPTQYLQGTDYLKIEVFHKPRESEGEWFPVEEEQAIWVGSQGKMLRIIVHYFAEIDSFNLSVLEISERSIIDRKLKGLQIVRQDTMKGSPHSPFNITQIDCKFFLVDNLFQFALKTPYHQCVLSVPFYTHSRKIESTLKQPVQVPEYPHVVPTPSPSLSLTNSPSSVHSSPSQVELSSFSIDFPDVFHDPPAPSKKVIETDLDVIGVVRARHFYQYSDIRLKTNIEDLLDAMEIVTSLQGKRYRWKKGTNFLPNEDKYHRINSSRGLQSVT